MNISRYHEYFACPIHNDSNKIHNPIQMDLLYSFLQTIQIVTCLIGMNPLAKNWKNLNQYHLGMY